MATLSKKIAPIDTKSNSPAAPTAAAWEKVNTFLAGVKCALIDGRWVKAASGKTFATVNPATGRKLAEVAECDVEDADQAVKAARKALEHDSWRRMSPADRGLLLMRLADLIEANADELALMESLDNGKPISVARAVDVPNTAKVFRYFAGWPTKLEGKTVPVSPRGGRRILNYTVPEPIGVVAQIIPWNFPLSMASWKLGPALAAGCTSVFKPAEQTPLTAIRLGELLLEAGFPAGVVNIVPGFGSTIGAALVAHDGIDKVAFTGSTEVGKQIVRASAGNLKRVSLELGGKSPNIVLPDADPDLVAASAADAIFFNQGQVCTAGSRLYVHEKCFDRVLDAVIAKARAIKIGPGIDPQTEMGPLVSDEQLDRVSGYIRSGEEDQAKVVTGGKRPEGLDEEYKNGYFLEPTVFTNVSPESRVLREEIFGPVLVANSWSDVDQLVEAANDTPYGLAAGIWTDDLRQAHRLADAIKAGSVWINCFNLIDAASPFGGFKQSGWGREMGQDVMRSYTETKSVWVNLT